MSDEEDAAPVDASRKGRLPEPEISEPQPLVGAPDALILQSAGGPGLDDPGSSPPDGGPGDEIP